MPRSPCSIRTSIVGALCSVCCVLALSNAIDQLYRRDEMFPPSTQCNLQGNWTSGVGPKGTWSTLRYGRHPTPPRLRSQHHGRTTVDSEQPGTCFPTGERQFSWCCQGAVEFWQYSDVAASPYRNPHGVPCTKIFNWCRFPYCPEHAPAQGRPGLRSPTQRCATAACA